MIRYFCCDERRRADVRDHAVGGVPSVLNGIDFLEVMDRGVPEADRQRVLRVHFVRAPIVPLDGVLAALGKDGVRIDGGVRIRNVLAETVSFVGNVLEVRVREPGDFSTYTLRLVDGTGEPLANLDPLLALVDFTFKVECPTDLDCMRVDECPPDVVTAPEIDYLARDFTSLRRLMLERMSITAPNWRERSPADLGVALVELLAYVGDQLSYEQDAVATEAYLGTARLRASVRRHARLLDYAMHDGCNARAWVQVEVGADTTLKAGTPLLTRVGGAPDRIAPDAPPVTPYRDALAFDPRVFETMHEAALFGSYGRLPFYAWGARQCVLPKGATKATLAGHLDRLARHQVLVFVEERGPRSGDTGDADPAHRQAVRLTAVDFSRDDLYGRDVTQIEWGAEDALAFPLCISSVTDVAHGSHEVPEVSVALGNIVLADHGRTVTEGLPVVPDVDGRLARVTPGGSDCCHDHEPVPWAARYGPRLGRDALTMVPTTAAAALGLPASCGPVFDPTAAPDVAALVARRGGTCRPAFDPTAAASAAVALDPATALPAIVLEDGAERPWLPRRDLLASDEFAPEFVAETDERGRATLRFGDDRYAMRPAGGTQFRATYRVGNGTTGNVGAASIAHIVTDDGAVLRVTNPMPAVGGIDSESLDHVRSAAPHAFRVQQRAVTTGDYAEVTGRRREVQRAAANVRWTGSWHTVFLSVDRADGADVDATYQDVIRDYLERFRMAGVDVEVSRPRFVPLEVELFVCIRPEYYRSDVEVQLLAAFGNRLLPDGRRGLFHPDNFTFGGPIYRSRLYETAQAVEGVSSVEVRTFRRLTLDGPPGHVVAELPMGPLEVARLDNDPNRPENGRFHVEIGGGR